MPLPMVHLAIAQAITEKAGLVPTPEFLLGNIAPDAIHMRPHSTKLDKEHVHLIDLTHSTAGLIRYFENKFTQADLRLSCFPAGYLTHLLTDYLWRLAVIDPFRAGLLPDLMENEIRRLYYQDTDQNDIDLYHRMLWRQAVCSLLASASAADFPPFLTAEEILGWRERTLLWYELPRKDERVSSERITYSATMAFIEKATSNIAELFETVVGRSA